MKIRKMLFSVCMFVCTVGFSQTTVYRTSSSSNSDYGKWTRIAETTLTYLYQNQSSTILISGGHSGSSDVTSSKLFFRTKQQLNFPGEPDIQLDLIQTNNSRLTENDIVAVARTGSTSTIDLYIRVTNAYEALAFTPVFVNNTSPVSHTFLSEQGFLSELPIVGTRIACKLVGNDVNVSKINWGTGNIGIGTSSPDSRVTVNGTIHSKEVKVDLNITDWPDYVFAKEYKLPALKEVAKHITEKGHLPNIPSAKDVEKNGIFVGQMNAKLLQKIEELTLYTIEQDKKIKELEKLKLLIEKIQADLELLK